MGLNQALVVHLRVELCQIRGPIIKKAPQRGVFYDVWAVRTRTAGSERQLTRTSVNAVRVLRSERDPSWRRATDGNLQSGYPPHKFSPQRQQGLKI